VIAQNHGVIVQRIHDRDHRVRLQLGWERSSISGKTGGGRLEVVHHRVALDVVAAAEQQGAVSVMGFFLLD